MCTLCISLFSTLGREQARQTMYRRSANLLTLILYSLILLASLLSPALEKWGIAGFNLERRLSPRNQIPTFGHYAKQCFRFLKAFNRESFSGLLASGNAIAAIR